MQPIEPNIKRKNQSPLRIIVNQWGCLFGLLIFGLGGVTGLFGAIFIAPQLLGFDVTATALMEREIVLAATEVELQVQAQNALSRATAFALDVQSTEALLNNNADLLAQTATQSSQNNLATQTSVVVQNVQRQTQVANDFVSTQAALNANATQVELDFRNTQAALGIEITSAQNSVATPTGRYAFDFSQYNPVASGNVWQLSSQEAWQLTDDGLQAVRDNAQLIEPTARILSENNFENRYTITFDMIPSITRNADYWLIFTIDETEGLAVHLSTQTLTVNEVGLYRFTDDQRENGLSADTLTVIQRNAANIALNSQTQLQLSIDDDRFTVLIDDETALTAQRLTIPVGRIGVQFPAQTTLRAISVADR